MPQYLQFTSIAYEFTDLQEIVKNGLDHALKMTVTDIDLGATKSTCMLVLIKARLPS